MAISWVGKPVETMARRRLARPRVLYISSCVAWKDGQYLIGTGNSFATPHIAGIVALIRAKHPELTPFQVKTVLWACAANVRRD